MRRILICTLLCCSFTSLINAQLTNTVGLLSKDVEKISEGYNLIFPHNQSIVYLLDNCGQIVHTWEGEEVLPGNAAYILENGDLVKCTRSTATGPHEPIWAGGAGETVEVRTWDNELLHSFTLNDSIFRLHHDVAPMPNGNILMIAWEKKNFAESIAAGRDPALMAQDAVWSEVILEWNPELDSIVWQWHVWDHLIQNYDATKDNFGSPRLHPELIDLNYDEHNGHPDWLHINSIDYNPVLDQFVLSVPYFNEFWIIDHSTTTAEAASSSGGRAGKGGDLLYRWGNPQAYDGTGEQQLFFQHDVHWINPEAQSGDTDYGAITLFNNRVEALLSTGNIIRAMPDENFNYNLVEPASFERTITHPELPVVAHSASLSSAQILPNGNALLLAGRWGFAYEITPDNQVAWEYRIPIRAGRPVPQGDTLSINNNITFRIKRYSLDYAAFEGQDLSPKGYWELNPDEAFCDLVSSTDIIEQPTIQVYPNPTNSRFWLEGYKDVEVEVFDSMGRLVRAFTTQSTATAVDVSNWASGIYFLRLSNGETRRIVVN